MRDELQKEASAGIRQKYWEECSIEEKIERMRQQVKEEQALSRYLMERLDNLIPHVHGTNGEILILMHSGPRGVQERKRTLDKETYF